MIQLNNVTKTVRSGTEDLTILDDVSFGIPAGQFVAVTGASGSGKSTLLGLIAGLDAPSSGNIVVDGDDVTAMNEDTLARIRSQKIGFVFQSFELLPRQTALRNVELPLVYAGIKSAERQERALEMLRLVGLDKRARHRPNELSSGERQRVAIARALVTRPALLLADEPTGNLDSRTGQEILELFDRLHQGGNTIILVTHDPEVGKRAARTVRVKDGRVESDTANARRPQD